MNSHARAGTGVFYTDTVSAQVLTRCRLCRHRFLLPSRGCSPSVFMVRGPYTTFTAVITLPSSRCVFRPAELSHFYGLLRAIGKFCILSHATLRLRWPPSGSGAVRMSQQHPWPNTPWGKHSLSLNGPSWHTKLVCKFLCEAPPSRRTIYRSLCSQISPNPSRISISILLTRTSLFLPVYFVVFPRPSKTISFMIGKQTLTASFSPPNHSLDGINFISWGFQAFCKFPPNTFLSLWDSCSWKSWQQGRAVE